MFEKQGKFYADWRDHAGRRLRKSFTSKRAALQFESEQKELAHPKTQARGPRQPHSFSPQSRGAVTALRLIKPVNSSSRISVQSPPRNSPPRTSPKSTKPSIARPTLIPRSPTK